MFVATEETLKNTQSGGSPDEFTAGPKKTPPVNTNQLSNTIVPIKDYNDGDIRSSPRSLEGTSFVNNPEHPRSSSTGTTTATASISPIIDTYPTGSAHTQNQPIILSSSSIPSTVTEHQPLISSSPLLFGDEDKKKADKNLGYLHALQLIPCIILVGGFGRITMTSVNFFGEEESFFEMSLIIAVPVLTTLFIITDMLFFKQMEHKDKWKVNNGYDEYKEALEAEKAFPETEENLKTKGLTTQEAKTILNNVKDKAIKTLHNANHKKIILALKNDIFIHQLLIQADIDKDYLIKRYEQAAIHGKKDKDGKILNIIELIEEASENVSRKNFSYSHTFDLETMRFLEFVQAIKIPLRLASVLLILHAITVAKRGDSVLDNEHVGIMIGAACFLIWLASLRATQLEFKKQDFIDTCEKEKRKIKSKHHDVLLSTLIMNLEKKANHENSNPVPAEKMHSHRWMQNPLNWGFSHLIYLKMLPVFLILFSLGRRPLTFYTFFTMSEDAEQHDPDIITDHHVTPEQDMAIVSAFVLLAVTLDLIYMFFSLREEKWKLDREADEEHVLKQCHIKADALKLNGKIPLTENEQKLLNELKEISLVDKESSSYQNTSPGWAFLGAFFEYSAFMKFAMRGLSLGFTLPRFFDKTDDLDMPHLDGMYVGMIVGAAVGLFFGLMYLVINTERERILKNRDKPMKELFNMWHGGRSTCEILSKWGSDFYQWITLQNTEADSDKKTSRNNSVSRSTSSLKLNDNNTLNPVLFFYKPDTTVPPASASSRVTATLI